VTGKNVKGSSLTGKDIKNNSVTGRDVKGIKSGDVRDRSLLAKDFKPGQLPAGPQGAKGDRGNNGATNAVVRTTTVTDTTGALQTAMCNPGERALGGGVGPSSGATDFAERMTLSYPVVGSAGTPAPAGGAADGWKAGYIVPSARDMTFYVICASP
jgi:hypothetical protein